MTFLRGLYELDLASLPLHNDDIRARWVWQRVNNKVETVLLQMCSDDAFEGTTFVRFFCGIQLISGNDSYAQGTGQILVTDRRILGMVDSGKYKDRPVDANKGVVYGFTFDHIDAGGPRPKTNWRGKPVQVTFYANAGEASKFEVQLYSVAATVKNDGSVMYSDVGRFLSFFHPDGSANFGPG